MAVQRVWRQLRMTAPRRRRTAPVLTETTGLSGTARRVNRVVGVMALFGAFGTIALALALTPEGQTSASSATAPQEDLRISRIEVPPAQAEAQAPAPAEVAAASMNTTVVAVKPPPEPAPKADRLFRTPRAPQRLTGQSPTASDATDSEDTGERDVALADAAEPPKATREAADSKLDEGDGRKLDDDGGNLEFGLSEPPAPGESGEAAAEDVEDIAEPPVGQGLQEVAEEADDEAVEETAAEEIAEEPVEKEVEEPVESAASEPAAPEEKAAPVVAATRTAPVTTDVNMRARPSNGAAVIQVVPGKSTVEVIDCHYWCEVVYEGRRGWIYKGFVRGS